jgi:Pyruvate/2-oxoacid:ferredoxin oxidoreductase delta subunit
MEDVYEKLRRKIDRHPMRAPSHPAIIEILKELFTPEEAKLALSINFKGEDAAEIAARAGVPEGGAATLLESMANKAVIYCVKSKTKSRYVLMPPMPGFYEFPLMSGEETPRNLKLAKLWEEYFNGALGEAMHNTIVAMSRIVPVHKKLSAGAKIFHHEEAAQILKNAKKLALAQCQCRFVARKCDAPLDVCILMDGWAEFLTDRGLARPADLETALDALDRAEEAGLVHMTANTVTPGAYMCNCCPCCCFMLRGITELGQKSLAVSDFISSIDKDACTGCEECVGRCPFDAVQMDEQQIAEVDVEKCFGCGQCATICPANAVEMVKREKPPEPYPSGPDLIRDMAKDKGMPLP